MSTLPPRFVEALRERYRIERELGHGTTTVYLAEDLRLGRRVAIKVLEPELAAVVGRERFLREIEILAGLTHPHILPLHDSGEAGGQLYFVMAFAEGESLRDRLEREKQLPIDDAVRIAREVAEALAFAHTRGIVHRDIKPANILLEAGHAVVADFGIARAVDAAGGERLTASGIMIGTPAYMSPEQAVGRLDVDGRSDVYSLGCVLYEMLAGQPPFTGTTAETIVFQHLNAAPPSLAAVRPGVPPALDRAIARALAKSPADRFATTGDFAKALARDLAPAAPPRRWSATRRIATAAALVVALAAAAWGLWRLFAERPAPHPAKKDWILVADFDGPPGDSTLAPAARSLLSAALDQSRIVATVPGDQIRQALRLAGKPPGARVDAALAKELAYRSAVRAVLEGTIGRLGKGYVVVVRVVDADTARVLVTRSATAKDDDALIPALGRLARDLRGALGENRAALAATRPMAMLATSSFEAYRMYVRAGERYGLQTGNRAMLRYYRAALALDPGFASARFGMAIPYVNLGYTDSARTCIEDALRTPDRLSMGARRRAEIELAALDGDPERAVAAWDRVLAEDPSNVTALAGCNDVLWAVGRYQDALDRTRRAMQLSPFGPNEAMRINEASGLAAVGRFDEAREANRRQTGIFKIPIGIAIEFGAGHVALAESLARAHVDDPRLVEDLPEGLWADLALIRFDRGAVDDAAQGLRTASERLARAQDAFGTFWYQRIWTEVWVVSEGAIPAPARVTASDTSSRALVTRGLQAVAMREPGEARRCLRALSKRPRPDLSHDRLAVPLIEARLAALDGRPEDAVRLLRPFTIPTPVQGVSVTWARWWMADAYEQMGHADSAAGCLERIPLVAIMSREGIEQPWVQRRLALLDARLGRIADAERHLAAATAALDQPVPAVRRLLDETRAAVRAARGMAQTEPPRR